MPFLRLTRDRRGFENTFLMHADLPGAKPRLLYWYRTAPGIVMGRAPLDEEAIRTIEEQHPSIDFDWPAILALGEVMIHEEEAAPRADRRAKAGKGRGRQDRRPPRGAQPPSSSMRPGPVPSPTTGAEDESAEEPIDAAEAAASELAALEAEAEGLELPDSADEREPEHPTMHGLLESLVGREIATRLRARHSEICARIHQRIEDPATLDLWLRRAEALDPDLWLTPEAILEGVRTADSLFETLREDLLRQSG